MGLEERIADQQESEREGLRHASQYLGEENIADIGRKIFRGDGNCHTDFDLVTCDGAVCEVFGSAKPRERYQTQLSRIATSIEWLKREGEHYSGRFIIYYNEDTMDERLQDYVHHLQEQHPALDIELAYRGSH